MSTLRLAGVINESIVDGPGIRMTVFVQGCPHRCEGCHNSHTWSFDGGYDLEVDDIIKTAAKNPLLKGLTLSGGEPFSQAKALSELAQKAHDIGLDIFTYSGYTFEEIIASEDPDWKALLEQSDYLVDGRFDLSQKSLELRFRGSKNQRVLDVKKSLAEGCAVLSEYNRDHVPRL